MYGNEEQVTLTRECEGIQVPSGYKTTLPAGSQVTIVQSLGGTYTVITEDGYMARIANKDADALGKASPAAPGDGQAAAPQATEEVEQAVWDQLRTCYDPEIPINIADLGLIYSCVVTPIAEGEHKVEIRMTLTAPGCGMGDVLRAEVESKVQDIPTVKETDIEMVFDPPWDFSMIPDAAKLTLGMM